MTSVNLVANRSILSNGILTLSVSSLNSLKKESTTYMSIATLENTIYLVNAIYYSESFYNVMILSSNISVEFETLNKILHNLHIHKTNSKLSFA